ncbi:ABC transporter ATP-binding protein [Carboxylicivirga sp. M1479]|uniref:ABC transporter ATP-binding protein n=1 Tax=Carboxylicivirga sp. M1479 TaxID=2594476 RepID=UPI00117898CF|nr:ABC transporter ATP-binding protein [Carboxylicivirga sp. M1479]TRX71945.1 ABC transporter ATP-binding protein [Carboxylicivirga sp. M1479]
MLKAENIKKSFGKKTVLNRINLDIGPAQLKAIVGENGAGKSTLVKIIVGYWKADEGKLSTKCSIGYCPQQTLVFKQLTIEENYRYFAAAYGLQPDERINQEHFNYLMKLFKFEQYKNQKVIQLSGGTIQKLNLALALIHQPNLLILDEPYNGFDWETYHSFWEFISLYKDIGNSVLLVSHLITDKSLFDRVYQLNNGKFDA